MKCKTKDRLTPRQVVFHVFEAECISYPVWLTHFMRKGEAILLAVLMSWEPRWCSQRDGKGWFVCRERYIRNITGFNCAILKTAFAGLAKKGFIKTEMRYAPKKPTEKWIKINYDKLAFLITEIDLNQPYDYREE